MSNLQLRVITAVVAVPLLLVGLYLSEWGYGIIFSGISLLCLREFYGLMAQNGAKPSTRRGLFLGALVLGGVLCISAVGLPAKWLSLILPHVAILFIHKLYRKDEQPIQDLAITFLGLIYTVLPFALLHLATFRNGTYHYQIPMGILFLLWASDTGAYFAGRAFGKTKLFPSISPKKTWEGFVGGLLATTLVSGILWYSFHELKPEYWFILALFIVVAGTYGDLTESMFKRSLAIKDSGTALPGHGGFLDRFDGLLIALPFICAFLLLTA